VRLAPTSQASLPAPMSFAALRIVTDVLGYRLRRLEMANLVAAVAVMLALRLPWEEVAVRTTFAFGLNLLVYLNNDYCDIEQDLSAGRESEKTSFLAANLRTALAVQVFLAVLLGAFALFYSPGLLAALVLGGGVCILYSAWLKRVAFADIAAMAAWGVGMTLVAFPLDRVLGWALVVQLGLFSAVFETIQVVRDYHDDRASGVKTTAVRLGVDRAIVLARAFILVSGLYGVFFLHRYVAMAAFAAALVRFTGDDPGRYWNRIRLVLGLAWLGILVSVFVSGGAYGLLSIAAQ
jgi:4-hydroxybenzoate polyprenyltransferase